MAKGVSSEYVQKFTINWRWLKNIFSQLNDGLITYEQTVSENIRRYLSEFTTSLTETAKTLGVTWAKGNFARAIWFIRWTQEEIMQINNIFKLSFPILQFYYLG